MRINYRQYSRQYFFFRNAWGLKTTLTSFIENEIICARIVAIVRKNKVSQIRIGYAVINLVRPFCEIRTAFSFLKTFGITLTARCQIYSVEIEMLYILTFIFFAYKICYRFAISDHSSAEINYTNFHSLHPSLFR